MNYEVVNHLYDFFLIRDMDYFHINDRFGNEDKTVKGKTKE